MNDEKALIPYSEIEKMAVALTSSRLFGLETKEQAIAIMLIAQSRGIHPAQAVLEYNIIQGKPAMKADAMLAHFQAAGGKVKWVKLCDKEVTAEFSHPAGGSVAITWTWEMAQKIGLTTKQSWRNYPRQMLRSRVISEGVRTCFPAIVEGIYSVEEVQDFADKPQFVSPQEKGDGAADGAVMSDRTIDVEVAQICGNAVGAVPPDAPVEPRKPKYKVEQPTTPPPTDKDAPPPEEPPASTTAPFIEDMRKAKNVISDKQSKRLFAIGRTAGMSVDELKVLVKRYGFDHSRDITRDKYEAICNEIEGITNIPKREPGQD